MPATLTSAERDLIVHHTFVDGDLLAQMEGGVEAGRGKLRVHLTPDQLEELLEWIAGAANHAEERAIGARLDALYEKLERLEESLDVQD